MDKKVSAGKAAGIVFCILAGICTVVLLFMDGYFSGQMKTINKYYTSVVRDDMNGFKSCFSAETAADFTEAEFEAEKERIQNLLDSEEVKTDVTFVRRDYFGHIIYFDLTVYNDDYHVTEQMHTNLRRDGMKWVISQDSYSI